MDTLEERTLHAIGNVRVVVKRVADYDADLSFLGEYCRFKQPRTAEQKLVHRDTGSVLDHHGIWRDEYGRIVPTPEENRYSREYEYIWCDNGHDKIKYAIHDANRLDQFNNGSLYCVGVVAEVYLNGKDIGQASVWGIECDSGEDYFQETEREIAHEALTDAKKWYATVCKSAA